MQAEAFVDFLDSMGWSDIEAMQRLGIRSSAVFARLKLRGGPRWLDLACAALKANLPVGEETSVIDATYLDRLLAAARADTMSPADARTIARDQAYSHVVSGGGKQTDLIRSFRADAPDTPFARIILETLERYNFVVVALLAGQDVLVDALAPLTLVA